MPMTAEERQQYARIYREIGDGLPVGRQQAAPTFQRANLPPDELDIIWALCDLDADSYLDEDELCIAMHLAARRFMGAALPELLPPELVPANKLHLLERQAEGAAAKKRFGLGGKLGSSKKGAAPAEPKPSKPDKKGKKGGVEPPPQPSAPEPLTPFQAIQARQEAAAAAAANPGPPPAEQAFSPMAVSRSGALTLNKKTRFCVLANGQFDVYSSKADADKRKEAKHTVELRSCPKVACDSLKSFNIVMPSIPGRGAKAAKPGETLCFSSEDGRELSAWANDLTTVWKALAPHAR